MAKMLDVEIALGRSRPKSPFCRDGEGLPSGPDPQKLLIRSVLGKDGSIELQVALEGTGRHFRKSFKNRDRELAWSGQIDFLQMFESMLANEAMMLFEACQIKNMAAAPKARREELLEAILEYHKNVYYALLNWDRWREVDQEVIEGVTVIKMIQGSGPMRIPPDLNIEEKIRNALNELGPKSQTMANVGEKIFGPDGDPEAKLKRALRRAGKGFRSIFKQWKKGQS